VSDASVNVRFFGSSESAVAASDKVAGSLKRVSLEEQAAALAAAKLKVAQMGAAASGDALALSSTRATSAHTKHRRELGELEKGARGAAGAFTGLGRAMFFASNAFLSGVIIGESLKVIYDATMRLQDAQTQLGNTVKNVGGNWVAMKGQVDEALTALSKTSNFTKTDLTLGMNQLVLATKDVGLSEKDLAVATDLARAKHLDLTTAVKDVVLVSEGHAAILRRQGIVLPEVTSAMDALKVKLAELAREGKHVTEASKLHAEALAKQQDAAGSAALDMQVLTQKVQGADAAFGQTSAGHLAELHKNLDELSISLGVVLVPEIDKAVRKLNEWLTHITETGQAQRDLRQTLDAVKGAFQAIWPVVQTAATVARDFAKVVGGWKDAFELVLSGWLAKQLFGVATKIGLVGTTAETSTAEVVGLRAALLSLSAPAVIAGLGLLGFAFSKAFTTPSPKKVGTDASGQDVVTSGGQLYVQAAGRLTRLAPGAKVTPLPHQSLVTSPAGDTIAGLPTTGRVAGVSGGITPGLKQVEGIAGVGVHDDFATKGHATHSYHYLGEAADLDASEAAWARLWPYRAKFAELFGPWGLYHYGIRFYDAKLQAAHNDHIHVAYTGPPTLLEGAGRGGGGGSAGASTGAAGAGLQTYTTPGAWSLPLKYKLPIDRAGTTTGTADDAKALQSAIRYVHGLTATLKGADLDSAYVELSSLKSQLSSITKVTGLASKSGVLTGEHTLAGLQKLIGVNQADLERVFPAFAAKAKKELATLDKEIRSKILGPEQLTEIKLHAADLGRALKANLHQIAVDAKAAGEAATQALIDSFTAQKDQLTKERDQVLQAQAAAAAAWVAPDQGALDALTKLDTQLSLQQAVDSAQKALSDAMTGGQEDAKSKLETIQQIAAKFGLGDALDKVQTALLSGTHLFGGYAGAGEDMLRQIQDVYSRKFQPDPAQVQAAQQALDAAQRAQQIENLRQAVAAETAIHAQEVEDLRTKTEAMYAIWIAWLDSMLAGIQGKLNRQAPGVSVTGPTGSWTPASTAVTGLPAGSENTVSPLLPGTFFPGSSGDRLAQGGLKFAAAGFITNTPTLNIRSRTVFGEAGAEAYLPLENPRAQATIRKAIGPPTVNVHIDPAMAFLKDFVRVEVVGASSAIANVTGREADRKRRSHQI
jgi:hypothetical protein